MVGQIKEVIASMPLWQLIVNIIAVLLIAFWTGSGIYKKAKRRHKTPGKKLLMDPLDEGVGKSIHNGKS
jgi:hypothetical protein